METFKILNFWLHLLSGMTFIGGFLFFAFTLLPTVKKKMSSDISEPFLRDIHIRFHKVAVWFTFFLLVTGGINIHFAKLARGIFTMPYLWALNIKIVFFTVLVTLFFMNYKSLSLTAKKPGIQQLPFQGTSLILGILILLMASFLKHLP